MGAKFSFQHLDIIEKSGIVSSSKIQFQKNIIEVSDILDKHKSHIYQDSSLDFGWFKHQAEWLSSLDEDSMTALKNYTHTGDKFLNMYAKIKDKDQLTAILLSYVKNSRNIFSVPVSDINADNILTLVGEYYEKIGKLFSNAPSLTQKMRVFRGLSTTEKSEISGIPLGLKKGEKYPLTPLEGIISTTYDTSVASKFITVEYRDKERDSCCIMDIVLNPGVKAIWISPLSMYQGENEIILFAPLIQNSISQPGLKTLTFMGGTITPKVITTNVMTYDVVINPKETKKAGRRKTKKRRRKSVILKRIFSLQPFSS